jgi:Zn finger protein HypA/HybF involved in hydrogenase expression
MRSEMAEWREIWECTECDEQYTTGKWEDRSCPHCGDAECQGYLGTEKFPLGDGEVMLLMEACDD